MNKIFMEKEEKIRLINEFFNKLALALSDKYECLNSCNVDATRYLVPNGTSNEVTYYSKPIWSFRVSDHWNWYANTKKCQDYNYVQCHSVNVPRANKRDLSSPNKATAPRKAFQVSVMGSDGVYHCIFGECYDYKKHSWDWIEPEDSFFDNISGCDVSEFFRTIIREKDE